MGSDWLRIRGGESFGAARSATATASPPAQPGRWSNADRVEKKRAASTVATTAASNIPSSVHPSKAVGQNEVMIASYNIENLFDTLKDPNTKDEQFFPEGQYKWTDEKLAQKIKNLGQVIRAMNGGKGPDILAINEVEHRAIVEKLRDDALSDLGYTTIAHLDTVDKRGIDNAILSKHPLIGEPKLHTVHRPDDPLWKDEKTREILEATFDVNGVALTVFVNHWPAADFGKRKEQRADVGKQLRAIIEAKLAADPDAEILVLGDFNASPGEASFGAAGLGATGDADAVKNKKAPLYNTVACLAEQLALEQPEKKYKNLEDVQKLLKDHGPQIGTHYDDWTKRWNTFDQIFVSRGLLDQEGLSWIPGSTQIMRAPFMIDEHGYPRATFPSDVPVQHQKPEQIGISDHLPLVARLRRH